MTDVVVVTDTGTSETTISVFFSVLIVVTGDPVTVLVLVAIVVSDTATSLVTVFVLVSVSILVVGMIRVDVEVDSSVVVKVIGFVLVFQTVGLEILVDECA